MPSPGISVSLCFIRSTQAPRMIQEGNVRSNQRVTGVRPSVLRFEFLFVAPRTTLKCGASSRRQPGAASLSTYDDTPPTRKLQASAWSSFTFDLTRHATNPKAPGVSLEQLHFRPTIGSSCRSKASYHGLTPAGFCSPLTLLVGRKRATVATTTGANR